MDVLKEKTFKSYDYTCRYTSVPYYYNVEDDKYIYGIGAQINKNIPYVAYKVKDYDTLDSLALKFYGNPTYYWVIAYFNNVQDCYAPLVEQFPIIKIPNISGVSFNGDR